MVQIFQGLAPSVIGSLADSAGRRPAYTICFIIYIGANIGLALQNQYAALFVLRCIQSSGSSGTIALSSGIVSDIATVSERGKYLGFITAGSLLGPSIGPVVGGILVRYGLRRYISISDSQQAQFLGWRAIFWFLVILAVAFLVPFVILFPETGIPPFQYLWCNRPQLTTKPARTAVGNGSIPPQGWNMSLINYLALRRARKANPSNDLTRTQSRNSLRRPRRKPFNPLASVQLLGDLETTILLLYNAFLFAGFYDITASLPSLYAQIYGFNSLQIGLCYIPFGVGCCCAALSNGQLLDRNFLRWARKLDIEIKKGRQTDLKDFPIEKVRLQVALPMLYIGCVLMLIYGWILEINGPLAPALVLLFFFSFSVTATFNVISTLLIDFYPRAPATATATNNLLRCLLGAGATGVITPMIDTMGRGWCFTFLSLFLVASSPMLWAIYFRGMGWREQRRIKSERKEMEYEKKQAVREEEGNISRDGIETEKTTVPPVEGGETEARAVVEEESQKGEGEDGIRHKLSRVFSHDSTF